MLKHKNKTRLLIVFDILFFIVSIAIVVFADQSNRLYEEYLELHLKVLLPVLPLVLIIYFIEGLYTLRQLRDEGLIISIIRAKFLSSIVIVLAFYILPYTTLTPKTNLALIVFISAFFLYASRKTFLFLFSKKEFATRVLVVGNGPDVEEVMNEAKSKPHLGFIVENKNELPENINYDLLVVTRESYDDSAFTEEVLKKVFLGVEVIELSKFCEIVTNKVPVESIDNAWFVDNHLSSNRKSYNLTKGILDKSVSIFVFIIFLPILLILIPLLLIFSGRPIFYSQIRTGKNNKPFKIFKLRTMTVDAEKSGAKWATPGDVRVTKIGKFLRVSRLDELPQLWNIFNGDMSLVGPRPERPEIIESKLEKEIPHYNYRHFVKPGVTGWAQVNYGYGYSERDSLIKLQYDLYYVKNKNIWLDIKIILRTVKTVITGIGH